MKKNYLTPLIAGLTAGMVLTCVSIPVQAAIALDRTRAIFDGENKSITLNISNENTQLPYLAQSWLEDGNQQKITTGPLVVTPPVQRLEPGKKSLIRIQTIPAANLLAQDKESLFYFNLREIPPRSEKANVLQIALQTKIKLFYRPVGIKAKPDDIWQEKLVLNKVGSGYQIENPTPYYITVIGMGNTVAQSEEGKFEAVMIAPKSSEMVKTAAFSTPHLTYINDYGGRPTLSFKCSGERCLANKTTDKS